MSMTLKQMKKEFRVYPSMLHSEFGINFQNENVKIKEFKGNFTLKSIIKDLNLNVKDNLNILYTTRTWNDDYKDTCGIVIESETSFNTNCPSHHYSKKHFEEARKRANITGFVIEVPKNTLINKPQTYSYRRNIVDNLIHENKLYERLRQAKDTTWFYLNKEKDYLSSSQKNLIDKSGYIVGEYRRRLNERLAERKLKKLQEVSYSMFNKDNAEIYNLLMDKKQDIINSLSSVNNASDMQREETRLDNLVWHFRSYERHIENLQGCQTDRSYHRYDTIEAVKREIKELKEKIEKI